MTLSAYIARAKEDIGMLFLLLRTFVEYYLLFWRNPSYRGVNFHWLTPAQLAWAEWKALR